MRILNETVRIKPHLTDLDGLRILHIGDFHISGRNDKIENFLKRLSKYEFDLLFITGDIIDANEGIRWVCEYIQGLAPRYGSWFCMGNHDEYSLSLQHLLAFDRIKHKIKRNDIKLLHSSLAKINVKVLLNESDEVAIGSSLVGVTGIVIPLGIDRYKPNHPDFSGRLKELELYFSKQEGKENEFSVVLTHMPDMVNAIKNMNADLYLAGHTHGGQIRLPFIGPVFSFSKVQRKYNRGLFKMADGSYMNVTAGLGQSRETPLRLFCPPEATFLTLKC